MGVLVTPREQGIGSWVPVMLFLNLVLVTWTCCMSGGHWVMLKCLYHLHHHHNHHHHCQRKRTERLVLMERKIIQKGNRKFKGKIWDLSLNSVLCYDVFGPPGFL